MSELEWDWRRRPTPKVLVETSKCPVCTNYVTALSLAIQDPGKNPPPSTEAQVRHEKAVHGGSAAYYRRLN